MKKVWAKSCEETIVVVVAMGECGQFEMAQDVQCGEGIALLRKAFDMLLLTESRVRARGWNGSRRVSNPMQEISTMDSRLIGSVIAEPFPCARIEVRRSDIRTVNRFLRESGVIQHRDVGTWARRRVA